MAFNIESIEHRVLDFGDTVFSKLESAAHSKVGAVVLSAVKEIVAVLPDGAEVEAVIQQLIAVADAAHAAVHNAAATGPDQ